MVRTQFIRYVLIGLALNAALYAAYLFLTSWPMGSETAMTITFSVGMLLSFLANRDITFRHSGHRLTALGRYLTCYSVIYLINFSALWVFAGRIGFPHQIVQGCAILVLALLAFIMQKYWVFSATAGGARRIKKRSA
ncbi:hypothetical protein A5773_09125 [Mycobacterium sp. 852014-52450_SCH5900713]|uniref:GtrA family protein n=1 Tax=Mycobacterium sp. 852014-52450_SCH5900713 TaxID=1834116 RepID=UPI0007FC2E3C|nr:GtrA family protein [Mycobacterium sp. 852014-52450_SCH5900713]OBF98411.1 hypothetical protein A5773_09125 [Mycobacterium sp. 852014-52450_SCH5900713]